MLAAFQHGVGFRYSKYLKYFISIIQEYTNQLFPDPETSVMSCWQSNTSRKGPLRISLTTPSSMSIITASNDQKHRRG